MTSFSIDLSDFSFAKYLQYLPKSTPHLFTLFCIQYPLVLQDKQSHLNDFTSFPMSRETFDNHFCFSVRNWQERRYHTMVTHSFLHLQFDHFYNNFVSLAFVGTHVLQHTGGCMFWILYACGSIAGSFGTILEYNYHNSKSRFQKPDAIAHSISSRIASFFDYSSSHSLSTNNSNSNSDSDSDSNGNSILESSQNYVSQKWQDLKYNYGNPVIDSLFQSLNVYNGSIGCSASNYCFHAFDFALTLDESQHILKKVWKRIKFKIVQYYHSRRGRSGRRHNNSGVSLRLTQKEQISLIFNCLSLYNGFSRISADLWYLWSANKSKNEETFGHLSVSSEDRIAHSAHIGGFFTGIGIYVIWKLFHRRRKRRLRAMNQSYSYRNRDGEEVHHVILTKKKNRGLHKHDPQQEFQAMPFDTNPFF